MSILAILVGTGKYCCVDGRLVVQGQDEFPLVVSNGWKQLLSALHYLRASRSHRRSIGSLSHRLTISKVNELADAYERPTLGKRNSKLRIA